MIPALDEEAAIGGVVASVVGRVGRVVVADNGSTDRTAEVARAAGAEVVHVSEPGYGRACLAGIVAVRNAEVVVFIDGDGSDDPDDLDALIAPIRQGEAEFVLGSRLRGEAEAGALTLPQRFGNTLACTLMRVIWGGRFTDLGPFRALTRTALDRLDMDAPTFGWTVQMQVRALKRGVAYVEVPVRYRRRQAGRSKISGTVRGVVMAGSYILGTIAREAVSRGR